MSTENESKSDDFEVIIMSKPDENTILTTGNIELSEQWIRRINSAMENYDSTNSKYSAYLSDGSSSSNEITPEYINELSDNPQNDLKKIIEINSIVKKQINKNDIVGKTVEAIETNINTEVKTSYDNQIEIKGRNKLKSLDYTKTFINNFNYQIKLKNLIRNSITTSYVEGTYISYLRHENMKYKVDYYPLGVCEISDYDVNGDPVVLFNIQQLKNRLQKMYKKTKKNTALFFNNIEEEIKANYPTEVYEVTNSYE